LSSGFQLSDAFGSAIVPAEVFSAEGQEWACWFIETHGLGIAGVNGCRMANPQFHLRLAFSLLTCRFGQPRARSPPMTRTSGAHRVSTRGLATRRRTAFPPA
jgi:hypothetical protein